MKTTYFDQSEYEVSCEWGLEGLKQLRDTSDAVVIIDVFSFTTTVDIAVSRGARVYPYGWRDESSLEYARARGALLAAGSRRDLGSFSLAPSSMLRLPPGAAVVLPSPNGAALSLETGNALTFAGCLRNASSVAAAASLAAASVLEVVAAGGGAASARPPKISVIPAGERWPDGSLRPGLEDLLGAGAVIHALPGRRSPEAEAAAAAFLYFRERLPETLAECSSGKEAASIGSREDVTLCAALDSSSHAPQLLDGAYTDARQ